MGQKKVCLSNLEKVGDKLFHISEGSVERLIKTKVQFINLKDKRVKLGYTLLVLGKTTSSHYTKDLIVFTPKSSARKLTTRRAAEKKMRYIKAPRKFSPH